MATTITAGNATNGAAISSDNTGILELKTGTGSGTTAMTVNASQNVGIGTSTPLLTASGRGNMTINGTSASIMTLGVNNAWFGYMFASGSVLDVSSNNAPTTITAGGANYVAINTNGAERARITSGGDFQFNSGYGSVATAYGCRAWVNFNGTGTIAIRSSGNVTSITDNNVGNYTVNFTNALPDVNYAGLANMNGGLAYMGTMATTSCQVLVVNSSTGAPVDVSVVTFGAIR